MAANVLSSVSGGDTSINSPRRSPWTQVLAKGAESEQSVVVGARVSEQMTNSIDCVKDASVGNEVDNSNAGGVKQVWGKPLKGNGSAVAVAAVAASADEVSPVMDTYSWPALSKDPPPKSSSSSDSLAEASLLASQVSGLGSLSSNKQAIANTSSPTSTPNHVTNTRQKSMRRGSNNGGFVQPSSPQPRAPAVELPLGKPGNTTGDSFSNKEGGPKGGFGNDHQPQRSNSFNRWGSGGQHQRGDGSYHHQSFGGRRDQDRGNQDWSTHRSYGSRENHMQQQQRGAPRGYPRAPHGPPFLTPLPVGPYPGHMGFPADIPTPVIYYQTPELLRGVGPLMPPVAAHHMYSPSIPDQQLYVKIMNQIEYYFSNENLVKDTFLRRNMDEQGWVSIKLIAGFKKVQNLSENIKEILDALQASTVVEVQNDKIRKRNEWMKWILAPGAFSPVLSPQSRAKSGHDMLAGQFQGVTLDEMSVHGHNEVFKKSPPQPGGEGDVQTSFEHNTSAGSTSK